MLKPYDARQMRCYPISTRINLVANDDEACAACTFEELTRNANSISECAQGEDSARGWVLQNF
jgi:hypothetical protein